MEKDSRWFVELSEVLQPLSLTGENALHFISVVILGSFGMAYWGAYTEHFYVGAISAIVFLLAMVAWGIVTCWLVWAVINGSVRWCAADAVVQRSRIAEQDRCEPHHRIIPTRRVRLMSSIGKWRDALRS